MLSLDQLTMSYGTRILFEDFSIVIGPHDRIGLAGVNGSGKSTLLKIIAGIIEPEHGEIQKAHYVTVGYLPQDGVLSSDKSLYDETVTAFEDIMEIQSKLSDAHRQLSEFEPESIAHQEILEIFGELQNKLEDLDAFRMKSKTERVLMGLGFATADFDRLCGEFSGGWQMRIALAKLLLREPSLLLLDEPTNHLDIESLQWLESYLKGYNGAVILVSHDRSFLDNLTRSTFALSNGRLEHYAGNYSSYEQHCAVKREQARNALKNQERKIKHTQEFIDRFRYKATKARQVQSRIKQLEKMERIELPQEESEIRFHFPSPEPSGAIVMELKNIAKRYGTLSLFENLSTTIERGDRIAVVGVNGAGKSTFARILAGIEDFDSGERVAGFKVVPAYFAQHQAEELDLTKDALETLTEIATAETRPKLRTLLGSFLFHGDEVFKKVGVLSGGEKSRLALAKMLLQPANFLIMDEPTNHLDMRSKQVLQDALAEYSGTYVIVAHDRSFLDPLVSKVFEFSYGKLRIFAGNISEYLDRKQREQTSSPPADDTTKKPRTALQSEKDRKRSEAEKRQEFFRKTKPLKDKLRQVEQDITALEGRKLQIELLMGDPGFYKNGEEAKIVTREYHELHPRIERCYSLWAELNEAIDKLRESL